MIEKKVLFICLILSVVLLGSCTYQAHCNSYGKIKGDKSGELYCTKVMDYCGNEVHPWGDDSKYHFEIRNKTQDSIDSLKAQEESKLAAEVEAKRLACFDSGKDINLTFDIIRDYNLSCQRIAYINDHLIDRFIQEDAGYITGEFSGFLSYGSIEGRFYVVERILATGQLVKTLSYHINCDNTTTARERNYDCSVNFRSNGCYDYVCSHSLIDTTRVTFYSEADFVMYYVNKCIKEE